MKIKVKFTEQKNTFGVNLGAVNTVSDGGYEIGYEQGLIEGENKGFSNGYNSGYEIGNKEGYDKGYQVGYGESYDFINTLLARSLDSEVELTIPNGIKHIGENGVSFWYKANTTYGLRVLNLNEVETIEQMSFRENRNLIEVNAPNLTNLAYDCFFNSLELTSLYFPNVINADNGNAFRDCQKLKVVEFDKLEKFSGLNFVRCYELDTLVIRTPKLCTLKQAIPNTNTNFANGTASIYVPDNLVEQYKVATNWVIHSEMIKPLSEFEATK